jgi:hypothetical protein
MNADFGVCTSDCSDLVLVITAFFYNYKYKLDLLYTHPSTAIRFEETIDSSRF